MLNNVHILFTALPNIGNTHIPIHCPGETPHGSQGRAIVRATTPAVPTTDFLKSTTMVIISILSTVTIYRYKDVAKQH